MATMFWRLLGRSEAGKSLLCDDETNDNSFFVRYWEIYRAFIRRLLGRGVGKPPSDPFSCYHNYGDDDEYYNNGTRPSNHHYIDIGIDEQILRTAAIGEVAMRVADDDVEEAAVVGVRHCIDMEIHEEILRAAIVIRVAEDEDEDAGVGGGGNYEIGKLAPAAVERPISRGKLGPYSREQKILLVGDGDFSFSASLAVAFGDASNMIATSLDSFDAEFLIKNYARAMSNIMELKSRSCKVMHGVNATKMTNHPHLHALKFDCIVYNFPHAGFSKRNAATRDAEISKHQALVRGFLANAKKMIKDEGQIHITHKCVGFFREWNIEMLGSSQGLQLVEESPFDFRLYPGYNTKYGYGGDKNFDCKPAKAYKFQLVNLPKKKRAKKPKRNELKEKLYLC